MFAAYLVLLPFVTWYFHRYHPHGLFAYILAVLPSIPGIGIMVALGLYLAEEIDEFQRNLMIQALLWASVGPRVRVGLGIAGDVCPHPAHAVQLRILCFLDLLRHQLSVSAEEVPMKKRLRATEMQHEFYFEE